MKDFHEPILPSVLSRDCQGRSILAVKAVEAELDASSKKTVVVYLETFDLTDNLLPLALSPPAAAELARHLRKAVKDYLRGGEETV